MKATSSLSPFFQPRSVAVVGASGRVTSVGHAVLKNLLYGDMGGSDRARGFQGAVYPVNPRGGEILGQPVFESVDAIGEPVDLLVVAIPPRVIPALIDRAGALGVRAAIIISAGFGEMGAEGQALQDRVVEVAAEHGMRLVGPNCLGVIRPSLALNASFAAAPPPAGPIGLLSQSGALITGIISYALREQFGLSAAVSLGAKADVDDQDVLAYLADDEETRALAVYIEAAQEPRRFYETLCDVAARKPVVAIKGGATEGGARAASSHTGSLAGSAAAYRAAFAQSGVLEASSVADFLAWSRALAQQPVAHGDRLAIITNAGGPGVLAADEVFRRGAQLAHLSDATMAALDAVMPSVWSRNNPIDVIGDATPERYRQALDIIGRAPEVDGIVVIMTVQAMTDPAETAEAIADAHADPAWTKPLTCSFIGLQGTDVGAFLDARGVPELNTPEQAVSAMSALVRRGRWLDRPEPAPYAGGRLPEPDLDRARAVFDAARAEGQVNLDLARARDVLACAGVRYNGSGTAADEDEAVGLADTMGYPVVLKVISPDVVHKTEVGGVVLGLIDGASIRAACAEMRRTVEAEIPGARISGFTVEQQVSGTEIIVGMSRDPDFGPLLMVGMGGIFVEVYKDVAFRLAPLDAREAEAMIGDIMAQALLDGARGKPRLCRAELREVLLRISRLVEALPEVAELDLNPLVITADGLVAIDARIIADRSPTQMG